MTDQSPLLPSGAIPASEGGAPSRARIDNLIAGIPYDEVAYDSTAHRWMKCIAELLDELRVTPSATALTADSEELKAAAKVCSCYFEIAEELIGEAEVRRRFKAKWDKVIGAVADGRKA